MSLVCELYIQVHVFFELWALLPLIVGIAC
jgi:hypothetical protein